MNRPKLTQEERDAIWARTPAWMHPDWRDAPESILDRSLEQLHGLASCLVVLGRADRSEDVGDELIDDALPMLGYVMMNLAGEALRAREEIQDTWGFWAEYRERGVK